MIIKNLGNNFFQLVHDYGSNVDGERYQPPGSHGRTKTPPNRAMVLFQYLPASDDLRVMRGSLMLSKAEIRAKLMGGR